LQGTSLHIRNKLYDIAYRKPNTEKDSQTAIQADRETVIQTVLQLYRQLYSYTNNYTVYRQLYTQTDRKKPDKQLYRQTDRQGKTDRQTDIDKAE